METKFFFQILVRCVGHTQLRVYEQVDELPQADELSNALISMSLYDIVEVHKIERTVVKTFNK